MPVSLDAGNSGSTIRMIAGLLSGQEFGSFVDGDGSLRRRPMKRIIEPLRLMGAEINAIDGNYPPLRINGRALRGIDYQSPVASAQIKSCVLLAGLIADGSTTVSEPVQSRNHTELMLPVFGAKARSYPDIQNRFSVEGGGGLKPVDYAVPGDLSAAAFFVAAASAITGSRIVIKNVGLNPTRSAFVDLVAKAGGGITRENVAEQHGETVGDITVTSNLSRGLAGDLSVGKELVPNLIDEIPILAVLATRLDGRLEVTDASELRIKESDRIKTVVRGIRALGGKIDERTDGFVIDGPQRLQGGIVDAEGDHRIAMAFSIAGLMARGETRIVGADCASVSFPEFFDLLRSVTDEGTVQWAN